MLFKAHPRKRRCMTLLEMLIAVSLTALLLTLLAGFYHQIAYLDKKSEQLQQDNFQVRYLESRLAAILPKILPEYKISGRKCPHFYFFSSGDLGGLLASGSQSLVFIYDSGANLDKNRPPCSLGRLFLDPKGRFCLASWPLLKDWNSAMPAVTKKEVLLEGIETLKFKFYTAPQRDTQRLLSKLKMIDKNRTATIPRVENTDPWVEEWKAENNTLPPMIKIFLTLKKQSSDKEPITLTLAYPLPYSKNLIVYED